MGLICESRTYSKGVGQTYCVRAVLSERAEVFAASTQLACACVLLLSLPLQVGEEVTKSLKNKK